MAVHGAHASTLKLAGVEYRVRRDFGLVCRIEERFGPLIEFGKRLEELRFTVKDFADLYRILLAEAEPPAPADTEIQAHILANGLVACVKEVHPVSTAFFVGEERFMERVAAQLPAEGRAGNGRAAPN